jgi:non-ribosomal peptide synthetase component E (peptide arylation enzyme)
MPDVIDCSIEAVFDEILGETMRAVVVIKESSCQAITPDGIKKYCAGRLSSYKIPQIIELKDKITLTAVGKKAMK